eukprot:symbB.v1.2.011456.t1/scaffold713.1/size170176/5
MEFLEEDVSAASGFSHLEAILLKSSSQEVFAALKVWSKTSQEEPEALSKEALQKLQFWILEAVRRSAWDDALLGACVLESCCNLDQGVVTAFQENPSKIDTLQKSLLLALRADGNRGNPSVQRKNIKLRPLQKPWQPTYVPTKASHCMAPPCCDAQCPCGGLGIVAQYRGACQECWKPIEPLKHCIVRYDGAKAGWVHSDCPDKRKGVLVNLEPVIDPYAPGAYAPEPVVPAGQRRKVLTEEQLKILAHPAKPGEVLRIVAVAGAGKTTTCMKLADRLLAQDPDLRIAYVVFNEKAMQEAQARFSKKVQVVTSHSLAKKRVWKDNPVKSSHPKLDEVARLLGVTHFAEEEVDKHGPIPNTDEGRKKRNKQIQKMQRREARFILKTLDTFLSSDAKQVTEEHVWYKALEKNTFQPNFYVDKAQQAYNMMNEPNIDWPQTHDGYLKRFQLARCNLGPDAPPPKCCDASMTRREGCHGTWFECDTCERKVQGADVLGFDVIIIDEAQDFTPCQAAAFFQQSTYGVMVFLVGDPRQRMYRWRGARDSFERQRVQEEFRLSESFRFGPEIAACANALLNFADGGHITKESSKSWLPVSEKDVKQDTTTAGQWWMGKPRRTCSIRTPSNHI